MPWSVGLEMLKILGFQPAVGQHKDKTEGDVWLLITSTTKLKLHINLTSNLNSLFLSPPFLLSTPPYLANITICFTLLPWKPVCWQKLQNRINIREHTVKMVPNDGNFCWNKAIWLIFLHSEVIDNYI